MNKINLLEVKKGLWIGSYGDQMVEYDNGDIYDILCEIADKNTDIYNNDLIKWLSDNYNNAYYVTDAIDEGIIDMNEFDLFRAIAAGQYLKINEELNNCKDDIIVNYALNYLINNEDIEELEKDIYEELVSNIVMCDTIDGIIDEINEILEVEEDE